jgi:hypothetical protein
MSPTEPGEMARNILIVSVLLNKRSFQLAITNISQIVNTCHSYHWWIKAKWIFHISNFSNTKHNTESKISSWHTFGLFFITEPFFVTYLKWSMSFLSSFIAGGKGTWTYDLSQIMPMHCTYSHVETRQITSTLRTVISRFNFPWVQTHILERTIFYVEPVYCRKDTSRLVKKCKPSQN